MEHDEAVEILAVLALDALDDDQRRAVEEHVAECPRCLGELDAWREVAGALGNSVEPVPEGLWSNIATRLYEDPQHRAPPLAPLRFDLSLARARPRQSPTSSRRRAWVATIGVAAALVAVLAVSLANADRKVSDLQSALSASSQSQVAAALKTPGHELVNLTSATSRRLAQFVVLPDGRGYLVRSKLPPLASNQTYQLWGIVAGKSISLGVMGSSPGHVTFTVASKPSPSELAVTVEPSGGTSTPSTSILASGAV